MEFDKKWITILLAYTILLGFMGYIAFFQANYNPVSSINEEELEMLSNDHTRELVEQALRDEGKAFQMKRDLAIQSFNIILGALLGFLAAAVTGKKDPKRSKNDKVEGHSSKSSGVIKNQPS